MAPCKFAEKVWNAQEAGAQGVRNLLGQLQQTCHLLSHVFLQLKLFATMS